MNWFWRHHLAQADPAVSDLVSVLSTALAGRYRVERELGRGAMATVYLAQDLKHHRKVALKVFRPQVGAVIGAERFLSEIATKDGQAQSSTHPPLHGFGRTRTNDTGQQAFLFYVMPFVDGESLRDRLRREKRLGTAEAVRIATEVADALEYADAHEIVHRDVKTREHSASGRPCGRGRFRYRSCRVEMAGNRAG